MDNEFDKLSGTVQNFYGVDNCKFKLGNDVYEAVEDPDDGYRSYLETIRLNRDVFDIFFAYPIAEVRVVDTNNGFYHLVDIEDSHVWLCVGTDNSDSYYPMFIFEYRPKPIVGKSCC